MEEDESLEMEKLIKEAKNAEVDLREIRAEYHEISKPLFLFVTEKIKSVEKEIKEINFKLLLIKEEQEKGTRKREKLKERHSEINARIRDELSRMDIFLLA